MADQHQFAAEGLTSPADNQVAITPSDSTDLAFTSRAIRVGVGGTLVVTPMGGGSDVSYTVYNGEVLPIRVTRVKATGTTASNLVNWY